MREITLPSGRTVTLKPVTGKVEAILEDKRLVQSGEAVDRVMAEVVEEVDGAAFASPQEKLKVILDMLTGDRNYLLLQIRLLAHGPKMVFNAKCPACNETSGYEADLEDMLRTGELKIHEYDPSPIRVELSDGGYAEVRHLDGRDERRMFTQKPQGMFSLTLFLTHSLNGAPPSRREMENLPASDLRAIREAALSMKGGLEPAIELKCLDCGNKHTLSLRAIPDFFTPSRMSLESAGL